MDIYKPPEKKPKNLNKPFFTKVVLLILFIVMIVIIRNKIKENVSNHYMSLTGLSYIYGVFKAPEAINYEELSYKKMKIGNELYEVSELPTMICTINPGKSIISYSDKMGRSYSFKAKTFLILNKLIVFPWFGANDTEIETHKDFCIFDIDYLEGDLMVSGKDSAILLYGKSKTYNFVHIEGKANSDKKLYHSIQSIDIKYDPYYKILYECDIQFEDGSEVADPCIDYVDMNDCKIGISWNKLFSRSNGDTYEHYHEGFEEFQYIDTYPMGVIIVDEEKNYYRYQTVDNQ